VDCVKIHNLLYQNKKLYLLYLVSKILLSCLILYEILNSRGFFLIPIPLLMLRTFCFSIISFFFFTSSISLKVTNTLIHFYISPVKDTISILKVNKIKISTLYLRWHTFAFPLDKNMQMQIRKANKQRQIKRDKG